MSKAVWIPVVVLAVLANALVLRGLMMLVWEGDGEGAIRLGLACFCSYIALNLLPEVSPAKEKLIRQCARACLGVAALFLGMGGIVQVVSSDTLTGSLYIAAALLVFSYIRLGWERKDAGH